VLTSLLVQSDAAAWFSEDLVLPADADWMFRRRIADRIGQRWPAAASAEIVPEARVRGVSVDPQLAARWVAFFNWQQQQEIRGIAEELLDQLIATSRLNEAACWLAAGNAEEAAHILTSLESGGIADDVRPSAQRLGEPIGADGGWAVEYEQAGRSTEERRKWLEALQQRAGSDLGPIDAEVFVRVVYRGAPPEVRSLAQTILVEQFAVGPNIALEMLDQLPRVTPNAGISEMIARLTSHLLPSPHSDLWPIAARAALAEHALSLLGPGATAIDDRIDAVIRSYTARLFALDPSSSPATRPASARNAAEQLTEVWRRRATQAMGEPEEGRPTKGGLVDLQRRHATRLRLVSGPVQGFVADQLGLLDLMAYVVGLERPALAAEVAAILVESGRRRSLCARALEQAVEAERAIGQIWRTQMAVDDVKADGS
jgi:hypothetical protein